MHRDLCYDTTGIAVGQAVSEDYKGPGKVSKGKAAAAALKGKQPPKSAPKKFTLPPESQVSEEGATSGEDEGGDEGSDEEEQGEYDQSDEEGEEDDGNGLWDYADEGVRYDSDDEIEIDADEVYADFTKDENAYDSEGGEGRCDDGDEVVEEEDLPPSPPPPSKSPSGSKRERGSIDAGEHQSIRRD